MIRAAAALLALCLAVPAHAAPAQWSLERASLGVDAKAAIVESDGSTSHFYPGLYFSYGVTSVLNLSATVERDFPGSLTIGRAGAHFALASIGEGGRLWGGVAVVGYGDSGADGIEKPTSWEARAQASYPVLFAGDGSTWAWGIASASYDEPNDRTTYRIGLRAQLIGGE